MRTLSYSKFFLTMRTNDFGGMSAIRFVSRHNNHKVFNPIILFIFNRTKRVFRSFMMDKFPGVKISTKMFCHDKAVFCYTPSFVCHRVEKIFSGNPKADVSFLSNTSTAFPQIVSRTKRLIATTSALLTSQTKRKPMFYVCPTFLTTLNASMPNILVKSTSRLIDLIWSYVFGSSYLSQLRHNIIISCAHKVRKGVAQCVA